MAQRFGGVLEDAQGEREGRGDSRIMTSFWRVTPRAPGRRAELVSLAARREAMAPR